MAPTPDNRRFRAVRLLGWVQTLLIVALLAPAFVYSMRTGFSLIDDHSDWYWQHRIFAGPGAFGRWLWDVLRWHGTARFRPWWELRCAIDYAVLGQAMWAHHLLRWGFKLGTAAMGWLAARRILGTPRGWAAAVPWWVALSVFVFFPNNPEARLAPQELMTGFWLMVANAGIAGLLVRGNLRFADGRGRDVALLLLGFVGLAGTKEVNIAVLSTILAVLLPWQDWRRGGWRTYVPVVLLAAVFVQMFVRVLLAARTGGYGTPTGESPRLLANLGWLALQTLQFTTHCGIGLMLVGLVLWRLAGLRPAALWRQVRIGRFTPRGARDAFMVVVAVQAVAFAAITATSWRPVLRYYYPLVPLLVLLVLGATVERVRRRRRYRSAVAACLLLFQAFFLVNNYGNFLLQYYIQYQNTRLSNHLLQMVDHYLRDGYTIYVPGTTERELGVLDWSRDIRPDGRRVQVTGTPPGRATRALELQRLRRRDGQPVAVVGGPNRPRLLLLALHAAASVQRADPLKRLCDWQPPYTLLDAGAEAPPNNQWYLYPWPPPAD